jgi:hypothetical protein
MTEIVNEVFQNGQVGIHNNPDFKIYALMMTSRALHQ